MRDRRSFKVLHFQFHQKHDAAIQSDNIIASSSLVEVELMIMVQSELLMYSM